MPLTLLAASGAPNLPAVAGFYSQLAGVLAGFGFAGLVTLIAAQLNSGTTATKTLESGTPLIGAFIALVTSSLNYAVVAGEPIGSARVAALHTIAGLGFSVAGVMLLYSILVLLRGLESDVPSSQATSNATANLLRTVIVLAISQIIVLLMWGGTRDHLIQKYGPAPNLFNLDWVILGLFGVTVATCIYFRVWLFNSPQHHPRLTRTITFTATQLAVLSVLGSAALISFSAVDTQVSDIFPLTATILSAGFAVAVAYSASRYSA